MNTPSTGRRRTVGLSAGTVGWCMALAVLVLAPVLRIGFVLRADMVFVPRQDLLPAWLGLGPGLPRSVPQDAVVAVVDLLVPGGLLQPLVLVAALSCAGGGAAWLLRRERWLLRCVAATAYVWTPFVAERLLLGNWALLVAYAVLPWAVGVARDIRARRRSWMTAIPLLAVAALTPTGGLLVAVVIVPIAVVRSRLRPRDRWALVLGAVLVNAPWWVSALLSPASATGTTEGSAVFALRSEGPWGPLVTALGTGGVWNSMAVPGSRGTWLAPLGTALLLALAALGARSVVASIGRAAAGMLALSSAIGVTWCLLGAWTVTSGLAAWLTVHVPGAGLLRDAQKVLAPWALLLALCVAHGVHRGVSALVRRSREPALAPVAYLGTVAALVLLLPDLAWGVGGVLHTTNYPPGWETARVAVAEETEGNVLLLPWSTYRAFPWNDATPVLDPAPRYLTRTTVADDTLVVRTDAGVVRVPGEDPRAAAVDAALRSGSLDAAQLRRWGIGAVLVETDQPGLSPIPAGVVSVPLGRTGSDAHLSVYAVPGPVADDPWAASRWRSAAVVGVDLLAALLVLCTALASVRERIPRPGLLHSRRLLTEE